MKTMSDNSRPRTGSKRSTSWPTHPPISVSLSAGGQDPLEDALEQDLDAASQHAADDEERLTKLEGQVHALSDAIIAIAEPSDAVDGAVKTVKDTM